MLAQILPGLREVRGPLAAGFLWMVLGWLLLHDRVASADGAVQDLRELGEDLPSSTIGVAAGFLAYLIGSLSEDLFGRALNNLVRSYADISPWDGEAATAQMSDALITSQITRLENNADRLRAESDLRVALLPPLIGLVIYFGITDNVGWFLGALIAPALAAQAWIRTREYLIASRALYRLRQAIGIPPGSVREADARTASPEGE